MFRPDPAGSRIGPFWLTPGWTRGNAATVWVASVTTVGLVTFLNFAQPYLLNEVLQLPREQQGSITGMLAALQELLVIGLAGFVGAWSERVGRRRVYVLGFLALACGYLLYPLADGVNELVLFRCIFAVGMAMAPLMLSACVVDASQEISRGRWQGANNLLQGVGVVLMALLLSKTPAWYQSLGADPAHAIRYASWTTAALCAAAAVIMRIGLPGVVPARHALHGQGLMRQLLVAAREARCNPRLMIAYGTAFIGRGDFIILGVFFSLWIVQAGTDAGMTSAAALARAGMLFGLIQGSALLWAFVMGLIVDRLHRVTGLCIALALASAGYLAMGQVEDPFGIGFVPVAVLLGMGEISVIVTSGALLGQEASITNRGPIVGFYNAMGGLGILFATYVGGVVFDSIGPTAPFTLMGLLNLAVLCAAALLRLRRI